MQIKLFAFQKNKHVMQTFKKQNHFRDCLLTFDDQDIWVGVRKFTHYTEVQRWEIFMEQKLRFGPVGTTEKKFGLIMSNF